MALAMEEDKPLDPADIGLLRPYTVVPRPNRLPDLIEQLELLSRGSARYHDSTLE
jgi:hypothetical protein